MLAQTEQKTHNLKQLKRRRLKLPPLYAYSLLDVDFTPDARRTSRYVQTGATDVKFMPEFTSDVNAQSRA